MATITITIKDDPAEEGKVDVKIHFDPPIARDGEATPAQGVALEVLGSLSKRAKDEDVEAEFDEDDE